MAQHSESTYKTHSICCHQVLQILATETAKLAFVYMSKGITVFYNALIMPNIRWVYIFYLILYHLKTPKMS